MIASLKKNYFLFFIFLSFQFIFSQHFNVSINETGESTLFIFQDSITSLEVGDEIGLFDDNAIIDSDGNTGQLLVGAGTWNGAQLEVTAISAVDLSQFGGPILPGALSTNSLSLKAWDDSEQLEYPDIMT